MDKKISLLSLSWRDIKSPKAGGAEVHTHEMLKRLNKDKYDVVHISMRNTESEPYEVIDGIKYIRKGNMVTVIIYALWYYRKNHRYIDYVIEQCNTHRFFTAFWVKPSKRIFYIHQLTKEIWDISAKFPINILGKLTENIMLKLNRHDPVITVSNETASELRELGFDNKIKIIHNGVAFEPWEKEKWLDKEEIATFMYAGRYVPYKGIDVAVEAVAKMKQSGYRARLWLLGKKNEEYVSVKLKPICDKYEVTWGDVIWCNNKTLNNAIVPNTDIVCFGYVSEEDKLELLSKSYALVFPSIREGWGIPITEAGCVGTPSIVYNSPGIAEAIDYGKAGYLCETNDVEGVYKEMKKLVDNKDSYEDMRLKAYDFSSKFKWDEVGEELDLFIDEIRGY